MEPTEDAKFCQAPGWKHFAVGFRRKNGQVKTEGELRVRQTGPRTRIPNEAAFGGNAAVFVPSRITIFGMELENETHVAVETREDWV